MTARRLRVVIVLAVAVVAAMTGGWLTLRGRWVPDRPLPAADADVSTVAVAYLDAAVREDCAFTAALTDPRSMAWCRSPTMTEYHDVGVPSPREPDLQCVPFLMTNTESADHSLAAGTGPWVLCFTRTAQGWRLFDQGHI